MVAHDSIRNNFMPYKYKVPECYFIKYKSKEYPWPCELNPDRVIELFHDDVLTLADDGTFTCHTGVAKMHIPIPLEDVRLSTEPSWIGVGYHD